MILHIMILEKFTPPFIDLVIKNFKAEEHKFIFITSQRYEYGLVRRKEVEFLYQDNDFNLLLEYMLQSDKIILHGIWRDKVNKLLVQYPQLLRKVFWILWGGEYYHPERYDKNHKTVIKNAEYIICISDYDLDFVRNEYGAKGKKINKMCYTSNIFDDALLGDKSSGLLKVLLGNSATPSNNHAAIINQLSHFPCDECHFYIPLSYPDNEKYRESVIEATKKKLGSNFTPLIEFIPKAVYDNMLASMDIAVFNSNRQQGFGIITTLLGTGCKVYLNKETTTYQFFRSIGVQVYPMDELELTTISRDVQMGNRAKIIDVFSKDKLIMGLNEIFEMNIDSDVGI